MQKGLGRRMDRRFIDSCVALLQRRLSSAQNLSILFCWSHPSGAGLHGSASSTQTGKWNARPGKVMHACLQGQGQQPPLHVKGKHSKQERRTKSNKFLTTWPKRSERDKSPPVVRRSAVEWPPPNRVWVTSTALDMGQSEGKH